MASKGEKAAFLLVFHDWEVIVMQIESAASQIKKEDRSGNGGFFYEQHKEARARGFKPRPTIKENGG